MKRLLILGICAILVTLYSCKEVPVYISMPQEEGDTTYVASNIETPQDKQYLIEELSGVQCVNCPAGMKKLTDMNAEGDFANKLTIVSIHVGTFAWFMDDYSKQDFVISGSDQLLSLVLGGDPGKPCASFDRLLINPKEDGQSLIAGYNQWPAYMTSARDSATTAPVNIHITSKPGDNADEYLLTIKLHYTAAMQTKQSFNIYLVENNIVDAMKYALKVDANYVFNHVLRKYITPPTGSIILADVDIAPGRVYDYKTKLTIDINDPQQKFWKPENMEVVAFVGSGESNTKKVYQTQHAPLLP
jgi:hypothetical protein